MTNSCKNASGGPISEIKDRTTKGSELFKRQLLCPVKFQVRCKSKFCVTLHDLCFFFRFRCFEAGNVRERVTRRFYTMPPQERKEEERLRCHRFMVPDRMTRSEREMGVKAITGRGEWATQAVRTGER